MAYLKFIHQLVRPGFVVEVGDVVDDSDDPHYWSKFVNPKTNRPPNAYYMSDEETRYYPRRPKQPYIGRQKIRPYPRPHPMKLTSLVTETNTTRLELPHKGAFNPGLAPIEGGYVMVYRPTELSFVGCLLDRKFKASKCYPFFLTGGADPRLIWTPEGELLMSYSQFDNGKEAIFAKIIMSNGEFIEPIEAIRISPVSLKERQKNWMPFVHEGKTYFVASVCPHIIYEFDGNEAVKKYETTWKSPWFYEKTLRGNCNIVQVGDVFIGTFHTAAQLGMTTYYDNGVYIFEAKPPFRVLRCSDKTYLRAEDGIEPHYRKEGCIRCTFPIGMVIEGERLLIAYGDNDSCVKILDTTVQEMFDLTVSVKKRALML